MDFFETYAACIARFPTTPHIVHTPLGYVACHNYQTMLTVHRLYGGQMYNTLAA